MLENIVKSDGGGFAITVSFVCDRTVPAFYFEPSLVSNQEIMSE